MKLTDKRFWIWEIAMTFFLSALSPHTEQCGTSDAGTFLILSIGVQSATRLQKKFLCPVV